MALITSECARCRELLATERENLPRHRSATRIQAVHRGKQSRKVSEAAAAVASEAHGTG